MCAEGKLTDVEYLPLSCSQMKNCWLSGGKYWNGRNWTFIPIILCREGIH